MKVPTRKQLMTPTIDAIGKLGGSASNTEIADQIIRDLELSPGATFKRCGNREKATLTFHYTVPNKTAR